MGGGAAVLSKKGPRPVLSWGDKPAALPVMQPTTFKLAINLKAEGGSAIDIPATLHARSDEAIE
jgi:hypothetical protein